MSGKSHLSQKVIVCPKCNEEKRATKHHVLPRRFFGHRADSPLVELCWDCHKLIETLIPSERRDPDFYFSLTANFLNGTVTVVVRTSHGDTGATGNRYRNRAPHKVRAVR